MRHIAVDQMCSERVPPLVRPEPDWPAVLVADVAVFQPAVERAPVDRALDGLVAAEVSRHAGKQHRRPGRPALQDHLLLAEELLAELVVDRYQRLALHLAVAVPQVGGAVGVAGYAVEGELGRVGDPQAAAHQDEGDQPVGGVVPPVEVAGLLDLCHDVPGQRPGQLLAPPGVVVGEERGGRREGAGPPVLPDCPDEAAQRPDVLAVRFPATEFGAQVGKVTFDHGPVDLSEGVDAGRRGGQEDRKPGQRPDSQRDRTRASPAGQSPSCPPFSQIRQPRLRYPREADGRCLPIDAQVTQPPAVPRVLHVPAAAECQDLDPVVGIQAERPPPSLLRTTAVRYPELLPRLLGPVQHGPQLRAGQGVHDPLDLPRDEPGLLLPVPALQHVLHLQSQLTAEAAQVDALAVAAAVTVGGEPPDIGVPLHPPAVTMGKAELRPPLGPQFAVADPAGSRLR